MIQWVGAALVVVLVLSSSSFVARADFSALEGGGPAPRLGLGYGLAYDPGDAKDSP
ncbi:hypothetical protein [Desulfonatronum thioautotrophicum]|uniref:hypothetical protein n=1 Tax=Desulfonatronum thioautotrophicum TaxID=617001 RepID=UPI0012947DCC|nr:hypothetical protein [Desulfonatronum thioautotrophicum]